MKAIRHEHAGDFFTIRLNLTDAEARDIRRALIYGLDVMSKQIADGSAEFKAGSYVHAEKAIAELAEALRL